MSGITLGTIVGAILSAVLSSTVISAVINNYFNLKQHNNTNSLKYITEERQKWREKIRDIAKNIEAYQYSSDDKDKQKLKEILVELKVNINPYGKENKQKNKNTEDKEKEYLKDAHIWEVISTLEKEQEKQGEQNKNKFSKNKGKLIDYLSCLLKYDWERAKYEVGKKSLWIRGLKVYAIEGGLMIWFRILFKIHNIEGVMYGDILCLIIIVLLFIVFPFVLSHFKKVNEWKNVVKIICIEIFFFLIIILGVKYYDMIVSDSDKNILSKVLSNLKSCLEECCIENIILIIVVSIYFIIIYLDYIEDKQRYETIQDEYIDNIRNINSYYKS